MKFFPPFLSLMIKWTYIEASKRVWYSTRYIVLHKMRCANNQHPLATFRQGITRIVQIKFRTNLSIGSWKDRERGGGTERKGGREREWGWGALYACFSYCGHSMDSTSNTFPHIPYSVKITIHVPGTVQSANLNILLTVWRTHVRTHTHTHGKHRDLQTIPRVDARNRTWPHWWETSVTHWEIRTALNIIVFR